MISAERYCQSISIVLSSLMLWKTAILGIYFSLFVTFLWFQ